MQLGSIDGSFAEAAIALCCFPLAIFTFTTFPTLDWETSWIQISKCCVPAATRLCMVSRQLFGGMKLAEADCSVLTAERRVWQSLQSLSRMVPRPEKRPPWRHGCCVLESDPRSESRTSITETGDGSGEEILGTSQSCTIKCIFHFGGLSKRLYRVNAESTS